MHDMAVTTATALLYPLTLETSLSGTRMAIGTTDAPGTNGATIVIARATGIIAAIATATGTMTATAATAGAGAILDKHPMLVVIAAR